MTGPGPALLDRLLGAARAGAHAAAGAPRLYRAARDAGAGRFASARLLGESAVVLFLVAPRAAGARGRQNAVRHFVWQARIISEHGRAVAEAVADAQERGSARPLDSAVDRRNNAAGQAYGASRATELRGLSTRAAMRHLLRAGLEKWAAGELAGPVRPARAAASAAGRRRGWRDRARPPSRP